MGDIVQKIIAFLPSKDYEKYKKATKSREDIIVLASSTEVPEVIVEGFRYRGNDAFLVLNNTLRGIEK